ncbi:MAG: hypothetical protein WDM78_17285 [Puia sp.]
MAPLLSLWTPDKSGVSGDIILGYDSLAGYRQKKNPFIGALIGRYAYRIHQGRFQIDGKTYTLDLNDRGNSLHGRFEGYDKVIWTVNLVNDSSLAPFLSQPRRGEEGYPGNHEYKSGVYDYIRKRTHDRLYRADDMKTPVNLTNHAYFNLSAGKGFHDSFRRNKNKRLQVYTCKRFTHSHRTNKIREQTPFNFLTMKSSIRTLIM